MAKPVNLIRNTNAILKPKEITTFGKRWAVQDGADGYPMVNVTVTNTTQDVKMYLEGSDDITVYPVASDVSKLCKNALTSFPNINTIFLFSATKVNIEEQTEGLGDYLSYLSSLSKIYVPSALLNDYQSTYASLSSKFDIIIEDLTITIEWVGNNTLTIEEVTRQLNTLESAYLNQATKLVIDDRYTDYMDTLWSYNFAKKCSSLNNNIWYGISEVDFSAWTITGSGALTSAIVENSISNISSDKLPLVTKIVIPNTFTLNTSASYHCLDSCDNLPNVNSLEINSAIKVQTDSDSVLYSNWQNANCKFKNVYYNYSTIPYSGYNNGMFMSSYIEYFESIATIIWYKAFSSSKLKDIKTPYATTVYENAFQNAQDLGKNNDILFESVTKITGGSFSFSVIERLFFPSITQILENTFRNSKNYKLFISTSNCSLDGNFSIYLPSTYKPKAIYFKATDVVNYMVASNWSYYYNEQVGVIDGGSTYTNIKNRGVSMNYPTLTGIDTEANIQLLTPADNSLYLASDTGNLWQYDSANSQWVNLFANLTGIVWYSDEDCTTTVLPSAMDTIHTYYVKASGTIGLSFANESWSTIKFALDNGIALYKLGDTKTITYNNATYTIRICDIGARYDIVNGNGAKNKVTFEFVELVGTGRMNTTGTSNGGFASSLMHTTTLPNIYNDLPSDLKAVISQVSVASASDGSASGSGSLSYSDNYLFLANTYEIIGDKYVGNSIEATTQYGLYSLNNTNPFRAKSPVGGSATEWWLRSPMANNATAFCLIKSDGGAGYTNAIGYKGISPFFCI